MAAQQVPFTIDADFDVGEAAAPWSRAHGADVVVRRGTVPLSLPRPESRGVAWQHAAGRTLILTPCGVRFLVEGGSTMRYALDGGASPADLRLFFLGTALGVLAAQRGLLPLGDGKAYALPRQRWPHVSTSLKALYVLKREQRRAFEQGLCTVERLSGVQALNALLRAVFRPKFTAAILGRGRLFQQLAVLQSQVGVFRFHRPFTHEWFDRGVACIAEALPAGPLPAVGCA